MKRFLLSFALIAAVALVPVVAQESDSAAQFLSFDLGVSIGPDLQQGGDIIGGGNFGINFAVIDKLLVGFNAIALPIGGVNGRYAGLRLAYTIIPKLGAAVGFGALNYGGNTTPAVSLGIYSQLFQQKASSGFVYGLGLKVDYLAPTDPAVGNFGDGKLLFGLGVNFGI